MKLYKSGLALKREGTDETVAAFHNEQDLNNILEAVMTKKKPNKPVPGDETEYLNASQANIDRMHRSMEQAKASVARWSQQTAPGADGYQHTVAVPGMPSAARDAALEEIAQLCDARISEGPKTEYIAGAVGEARHIAKECRALKSIAGPVASSQQTVIPELRNAFITLESNGGEGRTIVLKFNQRDDAYAVHGLLVKGGAELATPAPVQQAAPRCRDEHAAFEVWARRTHRRAGTSFDQSHSGDYKDNRIAAKWAAWLARSTLAAPAQPVGLSENTSLEKLLAQVEDMKEAAYAYGEYSQEAVEIALGGVIDAINAILEAWPVGLSEQDKLDAARYRALRSKDLPGEDFVEGDTMVFGERMDQLIDAILAAKEAS